MELLLGRAILTARTLLLETVLVLLRRMIPGGRRLLVVDTGDSPHEKRLWACLEGYTLESLDIAMAYRR